MKKNKRFLQICIIVTLLSLAACGPAQKTVSDSKEEERANAVIIGAEKLEPVQIGPESYDSVDTPILVSKDKDKGNLTFLNHQLGKRYTLSMDGTTSLKDKYGESVSLEQIQIGDIVDIAFLKDNKHLTSMQLSTKAWRNESVARYEIDRVRGEVVIGKETFKLAKNALYLSFGHIIEEMDLNASDVLSFQGIGNQVLSVNVEKGHGYLRLENDENFVGGWIEVGQAQIRQITEDMLLVVPEGSYQVNISHKGGGGTKNVVINRNEETTLDIGDFEIPEPKKGKVLFSVTPAEATLFVDGEKADISHPVEMEYGLHQLIVKAEGYKSITRYIRVGQESAGVDIELEAIKSDEDEEENGEDEESEGEEEEPDEDTDVTDVSTDYYKVHIDAPEGAEAYLDGNFVGITPCSFKKEEGAHVLTLRKIGYKTRSYTLQVDEEDKDINFSFGDLELSENETPAESSPNKKPLGTDDLVSDIIENILGQ